MLSESLNSHITILATDMLTLLTFDSASRQSGIFLPSPVAKKIPRRDDLGESHRACTRLRPLLVPLSIVDLRTM
jgi:hypothetical protein